jgi:hypothetical protein
VKEYHRSAVWTEAGFVRFDEGRFVMMWSVEDTLSAMRQQGFLLSEPEKIFA